MNYKNNLILIALLLIAVSTVTVGDNQPWNQAAFSSSFNLTLYANETVSYYIQYTGTLAINLYLFDKDGVQLELKSCSSSPCSSSFSPDSVATAGQYSMTIMPAGAFGNQLLAEAFPYTLPEGQVNIFGNSPSRSSNILLQETLILYYMRFHRAYVSTTTTNFLVTVKNLIAAQATYIDPVSLTEFFVVLFP